jgi:tetratricopeptide (TPR) repeat protein
MSVVECANPRRACPLLIGVLLFLSHARVALSDDVLALADWLLEQRSYHDAITEYKRFAFFNPEGADAAYAFYKMGLAYRSDHKWEEAVDALRASILATEYPKIADERRIILATTLIASGNYSLARLELLKVSETSLRPKSVYFYGIASLYMSDWDEAREAFGQFYSRYAGGQMTDRVEEIERVLVSVETSYKSARLARFLSTIMPGLGQMYAGDWRDGLNALVLNGLAIGLIANAIHRRDYRDAALISSISIRYYTGNIYKAEVDVRKYNESLDRESAMRILRLVRADEPSSKYRKNTGASH